MGRLARNLSGLFPDEVGVGVVAIGTAPPPMEAEAVAVARAVPHRVAEFAAGRAAARIALASVGLPALAIPMGTDRAPLWPASATGSITHGRDHAFAVAAPLSRIAGLGLDAEPDLPLPHDVLDEICDSDECSWIAGQNQPLRWARLIFAAKEAAYKCQYPFSKTLFGFEVMTVRVDPEAGSLTARFLRPIAPFAAGRVLHGRFALDEGLIIAGFSLPQE